MSIFNRKPTTLDQLRAAQANLEQVKIDAPREFVAAVHAAGHHGGADWHPCEDHGKLLIAEAELKLAEASAAYTLSEPEGVQLCSALDAALVSVRDALAPIADQPEPTLASTSEAKVEHEENCAKHSQALKANMSSRMSIIGSAATRIAKAAVASPKMLDAISSAVDDAKAELAGVVDPEAPVLGAVSPVTVQALSRALAAHRTHLEANEKRREAIRSDLLPVLRAINEGCTSLRTKRREHNLPTPSIFRGTVFGERPSLEHLANLAAGGGLTPEVCDSYRAAIGCQPGGVEGPKAALVEIADRRKAWEKKQADKAKERASKPWFGGER